MPPNETAPPGPKSTRRMMGGVCLHPGGVIFALARSDGALHLKGVGAMADRMRDEGWKKASAPTARPRR